VQRGVPFGAQRQSASFASRRRNHGALPAASAPYGSWLAPDRRAALPCSLWYRLPTSRWEPAMHTSQLTAGSHPRQALLVRVLRA